jgi:predicted amidophosphoribosyltransferase
MRYSLGVSLFCRQCHAEVPEASNYAVCPACGGALVLVFASDEPGLPPSEADRRGILLPRRHAVGGIITPR